MLSKPRETGSAVVEAIVDLSTGAAIGALILLVMYVAGWLDLVVLMLLAAI